MFCKTAHIALPVNSGSFTSLKSGSKQFAYIWSPFPKLMVRGIWSCSTRQLDTLLLSALHHASTIYGFPANLCSHGQPTPAAAAHSAS